MAESGITVEGLDKALAGLGGMLHNAEDLTPVFTEIGVLLHNVAEGRFTTGGAPAAWPRLKHPHPGPMLVKTGALKRSITEKPSKNKLVQKAAARYGWYQQVGSKTGRHYVTGSQASKLVGEGAQYIAGKKGRQAKVQLVSGQWAAVAKRGQHYEDAAGVKYAHKGTKKQARRLVLHREQKGRGGILPRPFLFLNDEQTQMVLEAIQKFVVAPVGGEEAGHASS